MQVHRLPDWKWKVYGAIGARRIESGRSVRTFGSSQPRTGIRYRRNVDRETWVSPLPGPKQTGDP